MTTSIESTIDPALLEATAERLASAYVDASVTLMVALGHQTGLFEAAAQGPATSAELATRSGLPERHVREWLGAVTTAGLFEFDPESDIYALPPERAVLLTGDTAMNQAAVAPMIVHLAQHVTGVADAFRHGGGVPYADYRPGFTDVMDEVGRRGYDAMLLDSYLPSVDGLVERLHEGTRVVDLGCGTGHCVNLMARRFRSSEFVGFDIAVDAIDRAREEAQSWGLTNARFEVRDVLDLPADKRFGVVCAFDAIHDQADPAGVLSAAHDALEAGGQLFMVDIRAASDLAGNLDNPLAPMIYAISVLHCMEVSLAEGGAGLGTAWGQEMARTMLAAAGFERIATHEMDHDPFNLIYEARRPAAR